MIVGIAARRFSRSHAGAVEMRHRAEQTERLRRPAAELRAWIGDLAKEGIRNLRLQSRTAPYPVARVERRERRYRHEQVRSPATGVVHLDNGLQRQLTLDRQIPRVVLGIPVIRRYNRTHAESKKRRIPLRPAGRLQDAIRERIVEAAVQSRVRIGRPDDGRVDSETCARATEHGGARELVEQTVAAANGGLRGGCKCETKARLPVVHVRVERRPTFIIVELHHAARIETWNADRRLRIEIPITVAVLAFPARNVEVVAQAEVERQPAGDLPVILEIKSPISGAGECLRLDVILAPGRPAEQHCGQAVAFVARAAVERATSDSTAEVEAPRGITRLVVVKHVVTALAAYLNVVGAPNFRQRAGPVVNTFLPVHDPERLGAELLESVRRTAREHPRRRGIFHVEWQSA